MASTLSDQRDPPSGDAAAARAARPRWVRLRLPLLIVAGLALAALGLSRRGRDGRSPWVR